MRQVNTAILQPGIVVTNGHRRWDGARFFCLLAPAVFFLALFLGCVSLGWAQELDELTGLAQAGAPELAVAEMDRLQPPFSQDQQVWMQWERERIRILAAMKNWKRLANRLAGLPQGLPDEFLRWAAVERARALLELGDGKGARRLLSGLIWDGGEHDPAEFATWRRLIVRSYLVDKDTEDAYAAMVRYRQDYGDEGGESALLTARVLLARGQPEDAAALLADVDSPEAQALLLLARLRSEAVSARRVLVDARSLASQEGLEPRIRQMAWAVTAEAAADGKDFASRIVALEAVFGHWREVPLTDGLFPITADSLWQAYQDYAQVVGNREQLLIGDDPAWFAAAEASGAMYPVRTRSLYAMLALDAYSPEDRLEAHRHLMDVLLQQDGGAEVLRQLYLGSQHFPELGRVPQPVRQVLADTAIGEGDLTLASGLMQGLEAPPGEQDRFLWHLRQAKVFILAGDYGPGEEVLSKLVAGASELDRNQVDRLMQPIFDLQTVGQHDAAYALFQGLLGAVADDQLKRELLYWMADSRFAQGRFDDAGFLYLRSAIFKDPKAMDPWAQTARYQAAKALAKAGLLDDARNLYRQLLAATTDPARRAVLRRDLQQLWLHHPGGSRG